MSSSDSSNEIMNGSSDEEYEVPSTSTRRSQGRSRTARHRSTHPITSADESIAARIRAQGRVRTATHRERHPSSDADETTVARRQAQGRERTATFREKHPDSDDRSRKQHVQRQHHYVANLMEQEVHDEPEFIARLEPTVDYHLLGLLNNECPYCGAIHFEGAHVCCQGGHVFVPPFNRMPQPLFKMLFDINNTHDSKLFDNVIGYNSLFSFASIQYDHIKPAKYGTQVAKAKGLIRHFTSTVLPYKSTEPLFGNYYIYEGDEAVQKRMQNPMEGINEDIVRQLEKCLHYHPMAQSYRTMRDRMKEEEQEHRDPELMRLKIVDKWEYAKYLQGHPGIYCPPTSADYVSMFFSADIDQKVLPRGLIIYPKLNQSTGTQLFHWSNLVNTMCYPLIFPLGEVGWSSHWIPRVKPESFQNRINHLIEEKATEGVDINARWDSDDETHIPPQRRRRVQIQVATTESDPNLQSEAEEDTTDDEYDRHYNHSLIAGQHEEIDDNDGIRFVERGGEHYPQRRNEQDGGFDLMEESDSGEDEDIMEGMKDASDEISQSQPTVVLNPRSSSYGYNPDSDTENENNEVNEPLNDESAHRPAIDIAEHIAEPSEHSKRKFISQREWTLYISQRRKRFRNRIAATRKLGQVFIIDMFTRILQSRMQAIENHCTQYMYTTKSKFLEAYQRIANRHHRTIGAVTTIPSYVPGSPRYMRKKYEEAITMANKLGPPDIFLTFTAAADWPEIKNNIPKGHTWADHPFLVCEVFKKKYEALLDDVLGERINPRTRLRKPGIFGAVRWYVFSIEFQQRGAPHMHLIISLVNHITTIEQIDAVCQAVIPELPPKKDPSYDAMKKLREMVIKYMIHRPCENDPEAYCHQGQKEHWKQCKKHFPKEFMEATEFGDRTYPALKRPDDGQYCTKEIIRELKNKDGVRGKKQQVRTIIRADNRHVVPYNNYLLTKFQSHMNVEIISSIAVVKYLFKYLFKGFDRSLVECIQNVGMEGNSSYGVSGQMSMAGHIMKPSYIKYPRGVIEKRSAEARKRLIENNVNLTDASGQPVLVYNECTQIEDMRATTSCEAAWNIAAYHLNGASHSVFTAFAHCPEEEPIHYPPGEEEAAERIARQDNIMTMMKAWFALNDPQHPDSALAQTLTYDELCLHFKFVKDKWVKRKRDWSQRVIGRVKSVNPRYMELFAIRLLSMNRRGIRSFEDLRTVDNQLYATFVEAARALRLMNSEAEWQMALAEAATTATPIVLRRMFTSIVLFCAPADPRNLWETQKENLFENNNWTIERKEAHALAHIQSILTVHNMKLRDFGLPDIDTANLPAANYLIDDSKEEIIISVAERIGNELYKVVCVAHTGVAASLLVNGSTVHSKFLIPIEVEENMMSQMKIEEADILKNTDIVIWDEACMTNRRIFDAVNTLFVYLHPERPNMLFGGIPFIMGGDWTQTLPIVEGVQGHGVIDYTLLRSTMWDKITLLRLHTNMRARHDPEYCKWIKEIGDGTNFVDTNGHDILLKEDILVNTETDLINFLYKHIDMMSSAIDYFALLTVDNRTALELNEKVLNRLPGEKIELKGRDECHKDKGFPALEPETYHDLTPAGMPPFKLNLKVGSIVILLRNQSVGLGLCNGTRMRVTKIGDDVVFCKPIGGTHRTPNQIAIHRIPLTPAKAPSKELAFVRWQFPLRLAYSMTINKAQGQTLEKVGILFRTVPFTHGQVYVAMSRVKNAASVRICNETRTDDKRRLRNVVYRDILQF